MSKPGSKTMAAIVAAAWRYCRWQARVECQGVGGCGTAVGRVTDIDEVVEVCWHEFGVGGIEEVRIVGMC